ncbi:MAG: 30S ribosomal protein S15 [Candidatus Moranbacteria bacterium]|nr:30S ribosomal protein S15 [Candidatus Moranbacteria bacterium]
MTLTKQSKQKIIKENQIHEQDTGSASVQIAVLSQKISKLSKHLQINKKDNHSKKGLLRMVAQRKKLINYLKNTDEKALQELAKKYSLKV